MLQSTSLRAFKEAGFSEEQAEALSEMMTDIFAEFATKTDLEREAGRLDHRLELSATQLRGEMTTMRQEMTTMRQEFNGKLSTLEERLTGAIERSGKEQTRWVVALVGLIATILAVSNYLT